MAQVGLYKLFRVSRHIQIVLTCLQKLFRFTAATILPNIVIEKLGLPVSYAKQSQKNLFFFSDFSKKIQEGDIFSEQNVLQTCLASLCEHYC